MKLSKAIQRGSKQTRPLKRHLIMGWEDGVGQPAACALGAAFYHIGIDPETIARISIDCDLPDELDVHFGLGDPIVRPSQAMLEMLGVYGHHHMTLSNLITLLNDELGWRRERIAAYVRALGY